MTQKRILRATTRKVARERGGMFRDAFKLAAADSADPDAEALITELAEQDPAETATDLFGLINQLADDLAEATGSTRAEVLGRLRVL